MKQKILAVSVVVSAIVLSSYSYMAGKDNTLTPSEKKTGWKLLFDGKSLNGWRAYQNKETNSWSAKDGVMYCKGSSTDKSDLRADMITDKQYENFDLSVDWKISPQGNSGILYLVTEEFKAAYLSGPEYQIIDDLNFPQKLEDWQKTGANYAMDPAPTAAPNPVGQWNTTRIVVNKGHVQHWLNGKKLLDFQMWTDEWKKKKTEGKWKDAPGYGMSKKGHIGLQDHGSEAWFKNLKIKEL
ncbi:3-keto-disaccharide hydrolase [Segetibacter aerophilus]|uniref:Glycosyl hydrolase n=1 Tax=Segetibacter aerophilus TaxID=670293 RepID=A0A512BBI7_9BACT|nr:DUF1080 domain-containing protein [Segetibacter aerophilus]GEO09331.1 glycosyl hydrolase [Segetibacter aerophilus]